MKVLSGCRLLGWILFCASTLLGSSSSARALEPIPQVPLVSGQTWAFDAHTGLTDSTQSIGFRIENRTGEQLLMTWDTVGALSWKIRTYKISVVHYELCGGFSIFAQATDGRPDGWISVVDGVDRNMRCVTEWNAPHEITDGKVLVIEYTGFTPAGAMPQSQTYLGKR